MGNIYEIGLLEVLGYIDAYSMESQLKHEREMVISSLYDDISPTITYLNEELGQIQSVSYSVEDQAIAIIEAKEGYDIKIQRFSAKARIFEEAMDSLTDRERDVVSNYYFHNGKELGLSNEYFRQVLHGAELKLRNSISSLKEDSHKLMQIAEKQEKIQHIQAWQQAN